MSDSIQMSFTMKNVPLLFFLMMTCAFGHAQTTGNALKHVGAGAAIGAVGGYAAHKIFKGQRGWTWGGAVGGSLAAGLAKEAYDVNNGAVWETDDVLFTALGGIISGLTLDLILDRRRSSTKNCGCPPITYNLKDVDVDFLNSATTKGSGNIASAIQANHFIKSGL